MSDKSTDRRIMERAQQLMAERGGLSISREDVFQAQREIGAILKIAKK